MRQTFAVEMDDGSVYRIETDARDIRKWEAEYEQSFLSQRFSFTHIAQLAYLAGKRTGILNGAFPSYEEFDSHCVDAHGVTDETPLLGKATRKAPTAASSASSHTSSRRSRPK